MKGYKIFGPDYTYNGYKFNDKNYSIGSKKFYMCEKAIDCLKYNAYNTKNTYAEVEAIGDVFIQESKIYCTELYIIKKLSYEEFGKLLTCTVKTNYDETSYVNGKKHGNYKYIFHGVVLNEAFYVNGKKHGMCKDYYGSGNIRRKCYYANGILNGDYKEYYESGQLETHRYYINGEIYGKFIQYYENGQLNKKVQTRDAYYVITTIYYDNGQLCEMFKTHIYNKKFQQTTTGWNKAWYSNGQLKYSKYFINNNMCGDIWFKENGDILLDNFHTD